MIATTVFCNDKDMAWAIPKTLFLLQPSRHFVLSPCCSSRLRHKLYLQRCSERMAAPLHFGAVGPFRVPFGRKDSGVVHTAVRSSSRRRRELDRKQEATLEPIYEFYVQVPS